ncbi:MAG: hypothetical protein ACOYOS_22060 [Syntrophales bacterium]
MVSWLDSNIYDENLLTDEKAAFLNKAVVWLQDNGSTLEELVAAKFCAYNPENISKIIEIRSNERFSFEAPGGDQ